MQKGWIAPLPKAWYLLNLKSGSVEDLRQRVLNVQVGETSRLAWLGVEVDPLAHSDDVLKSYSRPTEGLNQPSSKWLLSKNTIVSGLGLLGIKQGWTDSSSEGETPVP